MKSAGFHVKSARFCEIHQISAKSAKFHEYELLRDRQV